MATIYSPSFLRDMCLSGEMLLTANLAGAELPIVSLRYNAAADAVEVRTPHALEGPSEFLALLGGGPLCVFKCWPADAPRVEIYRIHFESATLGFPLESDASERAVLEVFILRGLRIEKR